MQYQVFVMEDEEQRTNFRNLSMHRANNEEEALNLVRVVHCGLEACICQLAKLAYAQLVAC